MGKGYIQGNVVKITQLPTYLSCRLKSKIFRIISWNHLVVQQIVMHSVEVDHLGAVTFGSSATSAILFRFLPNLHVNAVTKYVINNSLLFFEI